MTSVPISTPVVATFATEYHLTDMGFMCLSDIGTQARFILDEWVVQVIVSNSGKGQVVDSSVWQERLAQHWFTTPTQLCEILNGLGCVPAGKYCRSHKLEKFLHQNV